MNMHISFYTESCHQKSILFPWKIIFPIFIMWLEYSFTFLDHFRWNYRFILTWEKKTPYKQPSSKKTSTCRSIFLTQFWVLLICEINLVIFFYSHTNWFILSERDKRERINIWCVLFLSRITKCFVFLNN